MFEPKMPALRERQKSILNNVIPKADGYAPFLSTVPRASKPSQQSKQNRSLDPGPGSYDVSKPIVRPLIEALRKSNNKIIIKVNAIGSAAFKDHSDRFKEVQKSSSPGPGQYYTIDNELEHSRNQRSTIHNSLNSYRPKFNQVFNHKKTDTIPQQKILTSRLKKSSEIKEVPEQHKSLEHNKGTTWSKYSQQRFKQMLEEKNTSNPGPGSYDNKLYKHNVHPTSSFVSESIRSFFDNIIYETNQDTKAQLRDRINFKSDRPGPGYYEPELKRQSRLNRYQFFGSTEERLIPDISAKLRKKEQRKRKSMALQKVASRMLHEQANRNASLLMEKSIDQHQNKLPSVHASLSQRSMHSVPQEEPHQYYNVATSVRQVKPQIGSIQLNLHSSFQPSRRIHMIFDKDSLF